ncbi:MULTISPECIES: cold shock and DUF1294 domain-containing protein [unclassified Microcella]|uniref:DUF1294 domain-containing protein n=1 Tax=unclassified Microcella TaxID=2630066 RepID=UPI00138F0C53|nr:MULTISPECIES: cold shock and DUF1294 domain-containing protein [unclassified Microcella]
MTPSSTARHTGVLVRWNDDRGFGFIRRDAPGPKVFVHVSAFGPLERRPADGDRVRFAIRVDDTGRAQAVDAEIEGVARAAAMPRSDGLARGRQRGAASVGRVFVDVLSVGTLVTVLALGLLVWEMPAWVIALYGGLSLASALLYWSDKRNAMTGGWRTPESTLHLVAFAGGWPGAIVAQHLWRHKTVKPGFRAVFWSIVALNMLALAVLVVPIDGIPLLGLPGPF